MRSHLRIWLSLSLLVAGCAVPPLGQWAGPAVAVDAKTETRKVGEQTLRIMVTDHYRIFSTINDPLTLEYIPQLMEGAYGRYRELTPRVAASADKMECHIFSNRAQWELFTRKTAGADAAVYLQIQAGAYAQNDRFVAYYIGKSETFGVTAHEGWHQYCFVNFKGRLPPFLDEGIACMFETISWDGNLPRWNWSINLRRTEALRKALDAQDIWPLDKLIATHAGDIVGQKLEQISTFYAQSWVFARFLREAEGGKYRPAMERWLADTASGDVPDPTGAHRDKLRPWNRRAVKPIIEHYLGMPLADVEKAYLVYLKHVAQKEYYQQWKS